MQCPGSYSDPMYQTLLCVQLGVDWELTTGFVNVIATGDIYKSSLEHWWKKSCSGEFRREEQKRDCRQGMQIIFWINFATKQGQKLAKEVISREVIWKWGK